MTLAILLRTTDGLVAAADRRAANTAEYDPEETKKLGPMSRGLVVARTLGKRTFVAAAGSLDLLQHLDRTLAENFGGNGNVATDELVSHLQRRIVELRADGTKRYRAMYSDQVDARLLPTLKVIAAEVSSRGPRMTYVSESGDVEDRTGIGHDILGAAELYGHLHLRHFPIDGLDSWAALVVVHSILEDAAENPMWSVESPPLLWRADLKTQKWEIATPSQRASLERARSEMKQLVRQALLKAGRARGTRTP